MLYLGGLPRISPCFGPSIGRPGRRRYDVERANSNARPLAGQFLALVIFLACSDPGDLDGVPDHVSRVLLSVGPLGILQSLSGPNEVIGTLAVFAPADYIIRTHL